MRISLFMKTINHSCSISFFFFNDTATTEIYTLSLHDALPISRCSRRRTRASTTPSRDPGPATASRSSARARRTSPTRRRSEEHTSELQSRQYLVCRLLLEKKKKKKIVRTHRQ